MTDNDTSEPTDGSSEDVRTDGGVAAQKEADVDYLQTEINLLSPKTPFMQDHLKLVWSTFIAWVVIVWGPIAATWAAPNAMTTQMPVIGFPLHYFLVALGAPTGALILAAVYARQRDRLDEKYGINPTAVHEETAAEDEAAATDGGVDE